MARHTSSRGFTKPMLTVGFILVGVFALAGAIRLFAPSSQSISSQTVQSIGGSQRIASTKDYYLISKAGSGGTNNLVCETELEDQSVELIKSGKVEGWQFISGPWKDSKECESKKTTSVVVTTQPTPTTNPNVNKGPCTPDNCGTVTPNNPEGSKKPAEINDNTPTVTVTFNELPSTFGKVGVRYFYCLKTSLQDCGEDDWNDEMPKNNVFTVCGAGATSLKKSCTSDYWFHPGSTYRIFIAQGTSEKNIVANGNTSVLTSASFYVKHFYPDVEAPKQGPDASLNMTTIQTSGGGSITVTLTGRSNRASYGTTPLLSPSSKSDIYNDYFIQVLGVDNNYKSPDACVFIPTSGTGTGKVLLPLNASLSYETAPLTAGNYVLKIKDGTGGNSSSDNPICHEGEFTYWEIPVTIGSEKTGEIGQAIQDPRHKDTLAVLSPPPPPVPICYGKDKDKDGYCTAVPTALGFTIHTEPTLFVRDIFTIVLSIGGIAAVIFLIQAGYTLMTSAGNKEKVGAAREQITAAITGLIFIILSITILQFIGVNILHIPGFGN